MVPTTARRVPLHSVLMSTIRVALAQVAPRLGALDTNLARHHELVAAARAQAADLVVFPELGLTGYLLQDLNADVAMRADDARLIGLARAGAGMSVVVSFVDVRKRPKGEPHPKRDQPADDRERMANHARFLHL